MRTRNLMHALTLVSLLTSGSSVSGASNAIHTVPCKLLGGLFSALTTIGPSLVLLMMVYGAAKYAFSADDPGGRKQGKTIFIHAIIGAVIMGLIYIIVKAVLGASYGDYLCSGVKFT